MIIEEIKSIKSGRKELRQFGITLGIVLGLLGGLFWLREKDYFSYLFVVSAVFLLLGLIAPILLKPIYKVWMTLAVLLGWFMTRVILGILFFLVVTPIGLLARLFGKDFLNIRYKKEAKSYWIPKKLTVFKRENYERQF